MTIVPVYFSRLACVLALSAWPVASMAAEGQVRGWPHWRGPHQCGVSDQSGLPGELGEPLWTHAIAGRGSPVIADGRLYGIGFRDCRILQA